MVVKCIFCGRECDPEDGPHHIIPRVVRKAMNWTGKRAEAAMLNYMVPICGVCHIKLNLLQEPLIRIIRYLRVCPQLPMDFMLMVEDIYATLNRGGEDDEEKTVG